MPEPCGSDGAEMLGGHGYRQPEKAGEGGVDSVDGADAVAACADQVGTHPAVAGKRGAGVPVSRDGLVSFRALECLLRGELGLPVVVVAFLQQPHRRRGNCQATFSSTTGKMSQTCAQAGPASLAPVAGSAMSAPHPRHCAGTSAVSVRSGAAAGVSPDPGCPGWPPGLRSLDRSREDRSAERFALRAAFAAIGSFDGGVEEFPEFIPRRRRSSAFSASSAPTRSAKTATSPASSSYEGGGWASAGTTTMIDDQGREIKSGTPPRTLPGSASLKAPAQPSP